MTFNRLTGSVLVAALLGAAALQAAPTVRTAGGVVEGALSADGKVGAFKGIPYAAPPVGPLRWKPPQPVQPWTGVRPAVDFGPRAMQGRVFDDMIFRDAGPSEDCLYLNVWAPAPPRPPKLPVMVWIHGGGFAAGAASEPRQDGGRLAMKGIIVVSVNYRLGVFGFLALPGLARESEHRASGNYGLLDQVAALRWVRANIAAFGGDPDNVTIFGESAGSMSVSALMASPRARGLFQRAIGESGSLIDLGESLPTRAQAEAKDLKFVQEAFGTVEPDVLRARPARDILEAAAKLPWWHFAPDVDGDFLPADGREIYGAGRQSHVPLLAGWNQDEGSYHGFFGDDPPTLANYRAQMKARFGAAADAWLQHYPATSDAEARIAARDLEGDKFIAYSTWAWIERHLRTSGEPVYRYEFDQALPLPPDAPQGAEAAAPHAADIEFVFLALDSRRLPWRPGDRATAELLASYWTNFAKTGNPNGPGLPPWPAYSARSGYPVMHLQAAPRVVPDRQRARYEFLDQLPIDP